MDADWEEVRYILLSEPLDCAVPSKSSSRPWYRVIESFNHFPFQSGRMHRNLYTIDVLTVLRLRALRCLPPENMHCRRL